MGGAHAERRHRQRRGPPADGVWLIAVERVFREHAGEVLAGLIRMLGDFQLAEDALQDALTTALERWPGDGVPARPAAWITRAAQRKALDRLRRRRTRHDKAPDVEVVERLERRVGRPDDDVPDVPDERLALIFTCCHPALAPEARVALTLRTLGGLTTPEIARAFLVPAPTLAQRLVRAKRKIAEAGIPYRVPPRELLPERVGSVCSVVYLIFNEGYAATEGDELVRTELSSEAIRLARLLVRLMPDEPELHGLLGLLLLTDARRPARVRDGELVTLEEQDRALWDRPAIEEGRAAVQAAFRHGPVGPYTLQAAIAAVHAQADGADDTDWRQIVGLYDALVGLVPSPVVRLNRAAAVAMATGPEAGLALLDDPELAEALDGYPLFHAARADLLRRAGQGSLAEAAYRRALEATTNATERRYLQRRIREVRWG